MPTPYHNQDIPRDPGSRWIRVFDLQPQVSENKGEAIRGQLRVVCLSSYPSYEALSYAWGDPSLSVQIKCGAEASLPITANCHDALQQLRHRFRKRTIWVDAICINQANEEEKSHQVSLMQDIYSQARKVYVWLGNGTPQSDYAVDWLASTTRDLPVLITMRISLFPEFFRPRDLSRVVKMALEQVRIVITRHLGPKKPQLRYDQEAMRDLLGRDWFRRVWTIQELVMAREPILVCGSKFMRWGSLFWGIQSARDLVDERNAGAAGISDGFDSVLVDHSFWLASYITSEMAEAPIRKWLIRDELDSFPKRFLDFMEINGWKLAKAQMWLIAAIIFIRICYGLRPFDSLGLLVPIFTAILTIVLTPVEVIKDYEENVRTSLVYHLNRTRSRQATKEVDRVFALYGVLQKFGIRLQKPDYGKSVGQVYTEYARDIITWCKSLNLLTEAFTPGMPGSPSWVPDWSVQYQRVYVGGSSAAGSSSPRYSFSEDGHTLYTSGVMVDTVIYCTGILEVPSHEVFSGDTTSAENTYVEQSIHNITILTDLIKHALHISKQNPEVFSEAFFAAIHSDTNFIIKDKSRLQQMFSKWYKVLTTDYSTNYSTSSPSEACALAISSDESLNRYHCERCLAIADKRIFFITSKGNLGTGPLSTRISDDVAIFSAVQIPMILRKVELCYEVVGAAYVHGVMEGEAWPNDEGELRQLTLI